MKKIIYIPDDYIRISVKVDGVQKTMYVHPDNYEEILGEVLVDVLDPENKEYTIQPDEESQSDKKRVITLNDPSDELEEIFSVKLPEIDKNDLKKL